MTVKSRYYLGYLRHEMPWGGDGTEGWEGLFLALEMFLFLDEKVYLYFL